MLKFYTIPYETVWLLLIAKGVSYGYNLGQKIVDKFLEISQKRFFCELFSGDILQLSSKICQNFHFRSAGHFPLISSNLAIS